MITGIKNEYRHNGSFKRYVDKYAKDRNISVEEAFEHVLVKDAYRYYSEL